MSNTHSNLPPSIVAIGDGKKLVDGVTLKGAYHNVSLWRLDTVDETEVTHGTSVVTARIGPPRTTRRPEVNLPRVNCAISVSRNKTLAIAAKLAFSTLFVRFSPHINTQYVRKSKVKNQYQRSKEEYRKF